MLAKDKTCPRLDRQCLGEKCGMFVGDPNIEEPNKRFGACGEKNSMFALTDIHNHLLAMLEMAKGPKAEVRKVK